MVRARDQVGSRARTFLRNGSVGRAGTSGLAETCDRLIRAETQRSLPKALTMAGKFVKYSRQQPTMPLQTALRALGWTAHSSGKYRQAEKAYLEARQLVARRSFDRAQIDKILIDVYMYLGDATEARRRARLAIRTFRRINRPEQVARTRINYGNLFHRQDQHRLARNQYDLARRYLDGKPGNELVLGLCHYNLANTLVQLMEFGSASKYYHKARDCFASLDFGLYVVECDYGLAWLAMLQGDYHVALGLLRESEKGYRAVGKRRGLLLCELDRAEACLGLNLFSDAYHAARSAERQANRLGLRYEASKAAFFRARAAYAIGRDVEVPRALARARSGFRKEGNQGFEAATRLFEIQSTGDGGKNVKLKHIRRLVSRSQLPLWTAIGDLHILSLYPNDVEARRRLAKNPAVRSVPHLLAHWQTILGDNHFKDGNSSLAMSHWRRAAEVLDVVRAKLPPVELRAAFMRGRGDPYERIIAGELFREPARAAAWADRFKTIGAWAAPGEPFSAVKSRSRAERSLTELARHVSALAGKMEAASGTRTAGYPRVHRGLRNLHRRSRECLALLETGPPRLGSWINRFLRELRKVSSGFPVVQFHHHQDDFYAFVHHEGKTRQHHYPGASRRIKEWCGIWQIQLNRAMFSERGCSESDLEHERDLFEELGRYLWEPLEIPRECTQVLVVPDDQLSNLPWSAFSTGGELLIARHNLILAPTIQHHVHASSMTGRGKPFGLFVGSTAGLEHAQEELSNLLQSVPDVNIFDPCRRADWPSDGHWRAWHFTGHAHHRSDNPFYSSLQLADGPLFAADFRLKACRVDLVTLAACRTAYQPALPGEESTGLIRCMLEMGTRNVVGSHWAVSDRSAADWMMAFYKSVLAGCKVSSAVREASLEIREKYPSVYDWAPFSVYGAG